MKKIKILLSNDDGIFAEGLLALKREIEKIADVYVVAPEKERSASSHALTLHKPLRLNEEYINGDFFGYSCSGTPADCVVLGVSNIIKKPDLVISGINRGGNLGCDVTYSGTVSAAMEAAILKIPSFSISVASQKVKDYSFAAKFASLLAKKMISIKLPPLTFLNVNIPNVSPHKIKGVEITCQSKLAYQGKVERRFDLRGKPYYWIGGSHAKCEDEEGTDISAIRNNKISITPIHLDLTNYAVMNKLKKYIYFSDQLNKLEVNNGIKCNREDDKS